MADTDKLLHSTENTTLILGRIPERFAEFNRFTDSLMAVSLPDGTVGQILMRNGKAFLYGHYGEEEVNSFKDDEGKWRSNFVVTNSFEIDGDFIFGGEKQHIYAPFLTPGIVYINEDHELCTSVEDEVEGILQADNYDYRPTFVKSVSGVAKSQLFTDSGMTYNPFTKNLKVAKQVTTLKVYSETELTLMSTNVLDITSQLIRLNGITKVEDEIIIGGVISIHKGKPRYTTNSEGDLSTTMDKEPAWSIESIASEFAGMNFNGDTINVWSAGDDGIINFYDEDNISGGPVARIGDAGEYYRKGVKTGKLTSLLDLVYPIGAIYMSTSNVSPAVLFGGTWEEVAPGRVLMGSGNSSYKLGSTGGEYSHTLSTSEIPSHSHGYEDTIWTENMSSAENADGLRQYSSPMPGSDEGYDNDNKQSAYLNRQTSSAGNGGSHNNMQPYLVVNMWKRVVNSGSTVKEGTISGAGEVSIAISESGIYELGVYDNYSGSNADMYGHAYVNDAVVIDGADSDNRWTTWVGYIDAGATVKFKATLNQNSESIKYRIRNNLC